MTVLATEVALTAVIRLRIVQCVTPTVFREGSYRFYFFSREEERIHIHVTHPKGEAKFWLDPEITLARNHGLTTRQISTVLRLIRDHENEIRIAWESHFGC